MCSSCYMLIYGPRGSAVAFRRSSCNRKGAMSVDMMVWSGERTWCEQEDVAEWTEKKKDPKTVPKTKFRDQAHPNA